MKYYFKLLFIILSVPYFNLHAQKKQIHLIGSSAVSGQSVMATTFSFENPLYKMIADSLSNSIYFTTRKYDYATKRYVNVGSCGKIEADDDSLHWFKNVTQFELSNTTPLLILSNSNKSSGYNKIFGYDQINFPGKIVHVNEKLNVALVISNSVNQLNAHELTTGNLLWTSPLNNENNWNDLTYIDDSTIIIAASGLTSINLRKGKNWEIKLETSSKPSGQTVISENSIISKAAVQSIETSTIVSKITNLASNILVDNSTIFFADKNSLNAINLSGKLIWQQNLKNYELSQSIISIINGELLLFNLGKAHFGDNTIIYGKPFLIKLDKATGTIISDQNSKLETVFDFVKLNHSVLFANKKGISTTDITNSLFESIIELDEKKYGQFNSFINPDEYYAEREGHIVPLSFINSQLIFFVTGNDKVYGVSNHKIEYEYHFTELYKKQFDVNRAVLLKNGLKHYLVSKNYELLTTINSEEMPLFLNNKLFFSDKKKLHIVSFQNK